MTLKSIILIVLIVFLLTGFVGAVSEEDFRVDTTQQILNLCTATPDDPLYHQAINFCHGYLVGAFHYYEAVSSGPRGIKFVCPPDPRPSRNESIDKFIEWAKAHPQHFGEAPVETEFRFLMEHWPCK
ncbi:MAG: hypothetical protein JRF36_03575 [Deltaproteobacteria bacterium]|jgi:hypothetical protein|nr:hypothetical protein [Deltaproteobacteria bacterium]MBW2489321.1 hypothetical protein [Deltaproteobacteria bacterium]